MNEGKTPGVINKTGISHYIMFLKVQIIRKQCTTMNPEQERLLWAEIVIFVVLIRNKADSFHKFIDNPKGQKQKQRRRLVRVIAGFWHALETAKREKVDRFVDFGLVFSGLVLGGGVECCGGDGAVRTKECW